MAAQVPADFRFIVKAWSGVTDAVRREPGSGRATLPNPSFLDSLVVAEQVIAPAAAGLNEKLGVLLLQLSPLPAAWLDAPQRLYDALDRCFGALPALPHGVLAVELRDAALLAPALAAVLKSHGVRYAVGLHDRMPPLAGQLPMLRALWPGPLVCRWNLHRGWRYEDAKRSFAPFDRMVAPDPNTRDALARLVAATAAAGQPVYVAINNKAEGSAPLSVLALAEAIVQRLRDVTA